MKSKIYLRVLLVLGVLLVLPFGVSAESIKVDSNEVKTSMHKIEAANDSIYLGKDLEGYFYLNDYNVNTVSDDMKILLGWWNLVDAKKDVNGKPEVSYSKEEVKSSIQDIFGKEVKYTDKSVNVSHGCGYPKYDEKTQTYSATFACGGTGLGYSTEIVKAEKTANELIVYQKALYMSFVGDDNFTIDAYKADKKTKLAREVKDKNSIAVESKLNLNLLRDCVDTYKFVFKAEDGNYYFYSVENMKDAKACNYQLIDDTKTTKNNNVKNPNTADKNMVVLVLGLLISMAIFIISSRKIAKRNA